MCSAASPCLAADDGWVAAAQLWNDNRFLIGYGEWENKKAFYESIKSEKSRPLVEYVKENVRSLHLLHFGISADSFHVPCAAPAVRSRAQRPI